MMNRIIFDCERTKYPNTGLYHFCLNLGHALLQNARPEKESLYFYIPAAQKGLFGPGLQYLPQYPFHKLFVPRTNTFDVWHSTYQSSDYRPFRGKIKTVLTVHDLNFLIERTGEPAKIKRNLRKVQENINRADHIVCISAYTQKIIAEYLHLDGKKTEVIYNGCNINEFPGFDQPGYRPAAPFIFAIGTVLPKKNFHVLPCLLEGNNQELVIAGIIDRQYEKKIRDEARRHGVEHRVVLTGPVTEAEKFWYYKHCLAFAFPSLAEGFGFPVVEAMYYEKPVFLSSKTCLPEIGGSLAYYFDHFDPAYMRDVFTKGMQHFFTTRPAVQLRQRAMQYNWQHAAKSYLRAYQQVCE